MPYRTLNTDQIVATVEKLSARMEARFSGRGLTFVAQELVALAREETGLAKKLSRPRFLLRTLSYLLILSAMAVVAYVVWTLKIEFRAEAGLGFGSLEGVEAFINLLLLLFAAIWFLLNLENRVKRHDALVRINQLRSIAHVIDMHQLSKDPMADLHEGEVSETPPESDLHGFELVRYLDYCADLLAIIGKLAAVYAQYYDDEVVIGSVTDLERLTSELSRKVWQKITVLEVQVGAKAKEEAPGGIFEIESEPAEGRAENDDDEEENLPPLLR